LKGVLVAAVRGQGGSVTSRMAYDADGIALHLLTLRGMKKLGGRGAKKKDSIQGD